MSRIGLQLPETAHVPLFHSSLGDEAVALSRLAGIRLDEWQQHVLKASLNYGVDGTFAAKDVCLIVPRQNGKSEIAVARCLAGLFLVETDRTILFSAHEFRTAVEAHGKLAALLRGSEYLWEDGEPKITNSGAAGTTISLQSKKYQVAGEGPRVVFSARSKGASRGFTVDTVVFDEAYDLPDVALDAMAPTQAAVPNKQSWFLSSTGMDDSLVLRRMRDAGLAKAPDLAFFEWKADDNCDPEDRDQWYKANPSMGIRIEEEFLASQLLKMSPTGFGREHLGLWADNSIDAVIPPALWSSLEDAESDIVSRISFGVDVTPDYSCAAVYAAGLNADGLIHVKCAAVDDGTNWLPEYLLSLQERFKPKTIAVAAGGAAGVVVPELNRLGVRFEALSTADVSAACGQFETFAKGDNLGARLRHGVDPDLAAAVAAGVRRLPRGAASSDSGRWYWARRSPVDNISYLCAATYAVYAHTAYEDVKPKGGRVW